MPPKNLNKSNGLDADSALLSVVVSCFNEAAVLGLTLFVAGQYLRRHVRHPFLVLWACLAITSIRTGQYIPGEGEIWTDGFDVRAAGQLWTGDGVKGDRATGRFGRCAPSDG